LFEIHIRRVYRLFVFHCHLSSGVSMPFPLVALWKKDLALNSYIFCLFLIGLPFTLFGTYVIYQLQVVGFVIGTDIDGLPCGLEYCLVPFGSRKLDLNSAILYLNAMGFGLGGILALIISAYADFWSMSVFVRWWGSNEEYES
jgi:hypothetical protein